MREYSASLLLIGIFLSSMNQSQLEWKRLFTYRKTCRYGPLQNVWKLQLFFNNLEKYPLNSRQTFRRGLCKGKWRSYLHILRMAGGNLLLQATAPG